MARSSYAQALIDSLKDEWEGQKILGRLLAWLERHTFLKGKRYSIRDHEFQQAIYNSTHRNQAIIKPSQTAMSEYAHRKILAFLNTEKSATALYLLPTIAKSQKATKSRIDPIIAGSPYLSNALSVGGDSASYKQFGNNRLFMGGTRGQPTISDDIDLLVVDEYDFCDQENVITANSRLQHSEYEDPATGARGFRLNICTPTVPGFGVDLLYLQSNQLRYFAKCPHCGHRFAPSFLDHVRVPHWDRPMSEMTYQDADKLNRGGASSLLAQAKLYCPNRRCGKPIDLRTLHPSQREWVAEYPDRTYIEGWRVSPFDLPKYHTPYSVATQIIDYKTKSNHFYNFVLGLAYADASNSVVDAVVERNCTLAPVPPATAKASGITHTVMGLDVGLTSYLIVGVPNQTLDTLDVIWAEEIKIPSGDQVDTLKETVLERCAQFNCRLLVADHRPFIPTVNAIKAARPPGWMYPNNYDLSDKSTLEYVIDEKHQTIKSNRTLVMNDFANRCNTSRIRWLNHSVITPTIRQHLQGTKRVDSEDERGNMASQWVKTGPDHFFHAATYAVIASRLIDSKILRSAAPVPSIKGAEVGSRAIVKPTPQELDLFGRPR